MSLVNAGVEPLVLAFEMEAPVLVEVPVPDHRSEGENCLGSVHASSRAAQREAVGYGVAARALDDPGRDRPAGFQGLAVAEKLALVPQEADARRLRRAAGRKSLQASCTHCIMLLIAA
jgi:hypothetical protein